MISNGFGDNVRFRPKADIDPAGLKDARGLLD